MSEIGKEVRKVTTKIIKDSLVLIQTEILSDNFYGEDFTIAQTGLRTALTQSFIAEEIGNIVINKAKHVYNEVVEVQDESPPIEVLAITVERAFPWTFNFNLKTCTLR